MVGPMADQTNRNNVLTPKDIPLYLTGVEAVLILFDQHTTRINLILLLQGLLLLLKNYGEISKCQ
jgi:hypothetical protein